MKPFIPVLIAAVVAAGLSGCATAIAKLSVDVPGKYAATEAAEVRNSMILIDQVQTQMDEGHDAWNVEAAVHRTRPVVRSRPYSR